MRPVEAVALDRSLLDSPPSVQHDFSTTGVHALRRQVVETLVIALAVVVVNELSLDSPRRPSSTILIFSSAEYRRRVARRMSRMAFSALSFFFVIIVPLTSNDEPKVALIQTPNLVLLSLTVHRLRRISELRASNSQFFPLRIGSL